MCSCGQIGRERADQVLLRVPISFKTSPDDSGDVNPAARSGEVPAALRAVVETCHEYGRESVRRMVCTVFVLPVISILSFFLKLSYVDCSTKFPSTPGIRTGYFIRNVGRKLDVARSNSRRGPGAIYQTWFVHISRTTHRSQKIAGPEDFARSVAAVAPTLQELRAHPGADGVFTHRLMFAVRYAEFHQRRLRGDLQEAALDLLAMFNEDLAPKSWWGVLLCDAVELIRNGKRS
jgi:nuclear pore complex protein Nup85